MILFVIMFLVILVFTFAGIVSGLYIERNDLAYKWYLHYTGISEDKDTKSSELPIAAPEEPKREALTITKSHGDIRSKMRKQDTNYCILKKEIDSEY